MLPSAVDGLVEDEGLASSIFCVMSPLVSTEVHPEVEVCVCSISAPTTLFHGLQHMVGGFVYIFGAMLAHDLVLWSP